MAFVRVVPGGFAVGQQLTSAEMNQLDADHANALDKTIAGDNLAGVVTMSATAAINVNHSGATINSSVASGIVSSFAAGITTTAVGGFQLGGGANDWPVLGSSGRTRTVVAPLHPYPFSGGPLAQGTQPSTWSLVTGQSMLPGGSLGGGGTTQVVNSANANAYAYYLPLFNLHNGATLSTAAMNLLGATAHAALPQTMPAFQIYRASVTTAGAAIVSLNASIAIDPTATVGTYKTAHSWTLTCNQNNVIDTTQYMYWAVLWDEGGTNSVIGNLYSGITLGYTAIADMRFP